MSRGAARHRRYGFTLIELMITVAIAGILATLAVAGLGPLRERIQASGAIESVASTLFEARMLARHSGRCVRVEVMDGGSPAASGAPGDGLRVQRRPTADCESAFPTASAEVTATLRLPAGVEIADASAAPVEWRPNGRLVGAGGTFRITSSAREGYVIAAENGPVCVAESASEGCP